MKPLQNTVYVLENDLGELYAPDLSAALKAELRNKYATALEALREQSEGDYVVKKYHPECEIALYLFETRALAEQFINQWLSEVSDVWHVKQEATAPLLRKVAVMLPYALLISRITEQGCKYSLLNLVEARGV
jgi:hypothetical protein